jgi:hypothetical protein
MIEQRHIDIYRDLFVHRKDLYAQQTERGSYFLNRSPVTDDVIRAHLEGSVTAGWYALSADSTTKWAVLDADREDGLQQLQRAWHSLSVRGLPSHLELSRRGGHLWMFLEPMPASIPRRLLSGIVGDLSGLELFPKRDRLDATRVGNLVRGPLGVHLLTGHRYPFTDPLTLRPRGESATDMLEKLDAAPRISIAQAGEQLAALLDVAKVLRPSRGPLLRARAVAPPSKNSTTGSEISLPLYLRSLTSTRADEATVLSTPRTRTLRL